MQIQKLDTIIINICILINIYSIYILFKEVTCVKKEITNISTNIERLLNSNVRPTPMTEQHKTSHVSSGETTMIKVVDKERSPDANV